MKRSGNSDNRLPDNNTPDPESTMLVGHVLHRDDSRMTRTVLGMEVEGVKPRGRSTLRCVEPETSVHLENIYQEDRDDVCRYS